MTAELFSTHSLMHRKEKLPLPAFGFFNLYKFSDFMGMLNRFKILLSSCAHCSMYRITDLVGQQRI